MTDENEDYILSFGGVLSKQWKRLVAAMNILAETLLLKLKKILHVKPKEFWVSLRTPLPIEQSLQTRS